MEGMGGDWESPRSLQTQTPLPRHMAMSGRKRGTYDEWHRQLPPRSELLKAVNQ